MAPAAAAALVTVVMVKTARAHSFLQLFPRHWAEQVLGLTATVQVMVAMVDSITPVPMSTEYSNQRPVHIPAAVAAAHTTMVQKPKLLVAMVCCI
jgi:hypothetical protein